MNGPPRRDFALGFFPTTAKLMQGNRVGTGLRRCGLFAGLACAALLVSFPATSNASPLQHPKRLLTTYTVDLNPLFQWWSKHQGPRPLSSWVRITGSIVGTNALGWIVQGDIERTRHDKEEDKDSAGSGQEPRKFILRSPPIDDLVEFEELSSKLKALNLQRSALAANERDLRSRQQAVAEQQRTLRRNGSRSRVLAMEDRQLKQLESETKAQEKPLDQQIQELKTRLASFPSRDYYVLDCFALDLQSSYEQLPVYDHGQVMK